MEGEESDEDVQGEDLPTVLWERCIQQSIFVDLSEDESLHLSDLESSLVLHLSEAESAASESSIHLSGSTELSPLDVTSSESSSVSSQSKRVVESKTKSSILHVSAQRPNTVQDEQPLKREEPGQDTSDEDQDDLPYDGALGSLYFNQTATSEVDMSSDRRDTFHSSPDVPGVLECNRGDREEIIEGLASLGHNSEKQETLSQVDANTERENRLDASKSFKVAPPCPCPSDMSQLLLQHFSQEELLRSGRLIEAETLPEVSLLESVEDTLFSWRPTHNSTVIKSNHSESPNCSSKTNQSFCSDMRNEKTASKNSSLEEKAESEIDNVPSAASDSIISCSPSINSEQGSGDTSDVDLENQEKDEEDHLVQRGPLVRTRSFSDIKYGQGKVHYPLPDFSKVASKVNIPKAPSGPVKPVPQSPSTMHRAQSSPGMLDLINRVMEDSIQPSEKPYVFKDEDKPTAPALVHHLQAEYDKLLTKYAEAENLIDQMRIGTNVQPSSEVMLYLECEDDHQGNLVEGSHVGSSPPRLPTSEHFGEKGETTPQSNTTVVTAASSSQPEEGPSDGEIMTAELTDIISQFMQNVEEFKLSVSKMSMSTAEQQMMLRSMMEAQDQLERKYISRKEEHRALEMQNYMGLCRNAGTFDPNRLVEGDIFRIGMHLEDIKEVIDKNVCEQISPPHSSSTPTHMKEMLHVKPTPLCMPTPSPPPSLHERPSAHFSTEVYKTEEEEEKEEEVEEASEVHEDDVLQQSSELITTDILLKINSHSHSRFSSLSCIRSSLGSLEGLEGQTAEEERGSVLSEALDHSNILAYLSESSSSSRLRHWTPHSSSTPDSVLNQAGECDLGESASLAVEISSSFDAPRPSDSLSPSEPPLNTSSVSQRIVSPETDSGFGSSYLNQSTSGPFQQNLLTEGVQSQNDGLSSSASEGSCSNVQTAIHPVPQRWASPHPSVQTQPCGAAVEHWVESTTKEPSVRLQEFESSLSAQLHHQVSEPALSITMDTEERGSPLDSCSCNSEAILALQSEVSRLKKELNEGLVQLPHLAQKMDYLTSKYRQGHKSKTRPRTHHRPACNSSSEARIEDWISSDMEPSKSKGTLLPVHTNKQIGAKHSMSVIICSSGTDSGDTSGSEMMLQLQSSPVEGRRGSSSVRSAPESQYKLHEALQSNRGSEGKDSRLTSSPLKGGKQRTQTAIMESFYSKGRTSLFSSLQKPLLQVSYGSCSSLPASYKVREPPLHVHRKRSTQSDTALLPSDVYFQRTPSPAAVSSKTISRTGRRRGSKEEEMSRTLDQAIEVARSMKRTTDRLAKRLSADLAEAHLHSKLHKQPRGGRKHRHNKKSSYQFTL
ncbi:microtubule organization protein AKNA-like isoform X3 [Gymnodraco acuticeps]|uniref:Microtubule organization protein AKNA-like isoform X3 n=1 Tax=Gymnodraco acuticeps TaxID=8218 RepID=A0A6P8SWM1_GYMAC|nr:microtubule organization protein AKNA-like isoform X3 [Gymnodraco acuticeps]